MKYVSIDLETTGLDPDSCDVIEFAAVVDDTLKPEVPIDDLPHFRRLVRQDNYGGEPYALAMHAELLREAAGGAHAGTVDPNDLFSYFQSWIGEFCPSRTKLLVAGKNFAGFDMRFLRRLPGAWDGLFSHRVLDPAMLFTLAEDERPPSLELCLDRAGFVKTVSHRALDDARDVVRCVRSGLSRVRELSESKRTELERRLSAALMDKQAAAGEAKATLRVLKQVDTLKRQVAVLTDGSAQRRLKHLEKWQVWARSRLQSLYFDHSDRTEDLNASWLKDNPEPQFTGDDDAGGGEGA